LFSGVTLRPNKKHVLGSSLKHSPNGQNKESTSGRFSSQLTFQFLYVKNLHGGPPAQLAHHLTEQQGVKHRVPLDAADQNLKQNFLLFSREKN